MEQNDELPDSFQVKKSEWHQMERVYYTVVDEDGLSQLYPEKTPEEIHQLFVDLFNGDVDIETVLEDDWGQGWFEFEWDYDDVWTDRKGGYDVTYEVIE